MHRRNVRASFRMKVHVGSGNYLMCVIEIRQVLKMKWNYNFQLTCLGSGWSSKNSFDKTIFTGYPATTNSHALILLNYLTLFLSFFGSVNGKVLEELLLKLEIEHVTWSGDKKGYYHTIIFPLDGGDPCETTLHCLTKLGIGVKPGSSVRYVQIDA